VAGYMCRAVGRGQRLVRLCPVVPRPDLPVPSPRPELRTVQFLVVTPSRDLTRLVIRSGCEAIAGRRRSSLARSSLCGIRGMTQGLFRPTSSLRGSSRGCSVVLPVVLSRSAKRCQDSRSDAKQLQEHQVPGPPKSLHRLLRRAPNHRWLIRRIQDALKMPWAGDPRVNIQDDKGKARPYQVLQVLAAIDKIDDEGKQS